MPLQKLLCQLKNQFYWMQIIFLSGTKCLWLPQIVNKFLVWHKKFGPARNILGPIKGQGISGLKHLTSHQEVFGLRTGLRFDFFFFFFFLSNFFSLFNFCFCAFLWITMNLEFILINYIMFQVPGPCYSLSLGLIPTVPGPTTTKEIWRASQDREEEKNDASQSIKLDFTCHTKR